VATGPTIAPLRLLRNGQTGGDGGWGVASAPSKQKTRPEADSRRAERVEKEKRERKEKKVKREKKKKEKKRARLERERQRSDGDQARRQSATTVVEKAPQTRRLLDWGDGTEASGGGTFVHIELSQDQRGRLPSETEPSRETGPARVSNWLMGALGFLTLAVLGWLGWKLYCLVHWLASSAWEGLCCGWCERGGEGRGWHWRVLFGLLGTGHGLAGAVGAGLQLIRWLAGGVLGCLGTATRLTQGLLGAVAGLLQALLRLPGRLLRLPGLVLRLPGTGLRLIRARLLGRNKERQSPESSPDASAGEDEDCWEEVEEEDEVNQLSRRSLSRRTASPAASPFRRHFAPRTVSGSWHTAKSSKDSSRGWLGVSGGEGLPLSEELPGLEEESRLSKGAPSTSSLQLPLSSKPAPWQASQSAKDLCGRMRQLRLCDQRESTANSDNNAGAESHRRPAPQPPFALHYSDWE
jgi:hypothetical protein